MTESSDKITREELREMFGDEIPIEVVNLIWNDGDPGMTIGEARTKIREIAKRINQGYDLRLALEALVSAVGNMKVPQTVNDVALMMTVTLGPAYEQAKAALARPKSQTAVHQLPCPVCGGEAIHAIDVIKRTVIKPVVELYGPEIERLSMYTLKEENNKLTTRIAELEILLGEECNR